MLLTATTAYINSHIIPVLAGLVEAGIVFRIAIKISDGLHEEVSFGEIFQRIRKLLMAAAIGICIIAVVSSIKHYF